MLYALLTEVSITLQEKLEWEREASSLIISSVIRVYTLINRLLCQIQRQIAEGYSVIWNCKAVDELCFCMEDIFNHGLKERLVGMSEIIVSIDSL